MNGISALRKEKQKLLNKGKISEAAAVCNLLGVKLQERGDFDEALNEHQEEIVLYESQKDVMGIAVANRRLGEIHSETGNFENALHHQRIHLEFAQNMRNILEEQRAHATIGRTHFLHSETLENTNSIYIQKKALKEAENSYLKSLETCKKLTGLVDAKELGQMRCRVYHNLGLVLDSKGNSLKAIEFINSGLEISKKYTLIEDAYRAYAELARIHLREGSLDRAKEEGNLCLQMAQQLQYKNDQADAQVLLGSIFIHEGNFEKGKRYFYQAHKLKHSRRNVGIVIKNSLKTIIKICLQKEILNHRDTTDDGILSCYDKLGDYCCELHLFSQAIDFYSKMLSKALELQKTPSELASIYVSLAQTYKDNKQYIEAFQYFQKELQVRSETDIKENIRTLLELDKLSELTSATTITYIDKALRLARKSNNPRYVAHIISEWLKKKRLDSKVTEDLETELLSVVEDNSLQEYEFLSSDEKSNSSVLDQSSLSDFTDSEEERVVHRLPKRGEHKIKINEQGESLLHRACIRGKISLVKQLISQGHPINPRDHCGWTPLHEACNFGHTEIVRVLIESGANVNDKGGIGCQGTTPLHDAATNGHLNVVRLLLEHNASLTAKDDDGNTPLDCLFLYSEQDDIDGMEMDDCRQLQNNLIKRMKSAGNQVPKKLSDLIEHHRNNIPIKVVAEDTYDVYSSESDFCSKNEQNSAPVNKIHRKSATDAYKDVMKSIGSRSKNYLSLTSEKEKNPSKSLISESDYVSDNWLVDSGTMPRYKRKRSPSPITRPHNFSNRSERQSKLIKLVEKDWLDENEVQSEDIETNLLSPLNTHPPHGTSSGVSHLRVSVKICGKKILIPISEGCQTKPISWLQEEVSKRYLHLEGIRTSLVLLTEQFEALNSSDLIYTVLSNENNKLVASIIKYDVAPLSKRYEEVCNILQAKFCGNIKAMLRKSETLNILDLSRLFIRDHSTIASILMSLQYQNVTYLNLSSNKLGSPGNLIEAITKMPCLIELVLKCCSLTSEWFAEFAKNLDNSHCDMRRIDLSYNHFSDVKMLDFLNLCRKPQLYSVIIQSSQLRLVGALVNDKCLSNITILNLDQNSLREKAVEFIFLIFDSLTHFSIAYNAQTFANNFRNGLIEFLAKGDYSCLMELNVAGCDLKDDDVRILISYLYRCCNLKILNLSNNPSLSPSSMVDLLHEISKGANVPLEKLFLEGIQSLQQSHFLNQVKIFMKHKHNRGLPLLALHLSKPELLHDVENIWMDIHLDRSVIKRHSNCLFLFCSDQMS